MSLSYEEPKEKFLFESDIVALEVAELRAEHDAEQALRQEDPIFEMCWKILLGDPEEDKKSRRRCAAKRAAETRRANKTAAAERAARTKQVKYVSFDGSIAAKLRTLVANCKSRVLSVVERQSNPTHGNDYELVPDDLREIYLTIAETGAKSGFTAMHHFEMLHSHQTRGGQWISICKKNPADSLNRALKPWSQWMYRQDHFLVLDELESLSGAMDTYISANQFHMPKRYAERLSGITSIYFDIDNVEQKLGMSKKLAAAKLLKSFDDKRIPRPSVIMDSGNGLHVYFVFDTIQNDSKAKKWKLIWTKIADIIDGTFRDACDAVVDRSVSDVARVLRLAGTVNSKNNKTVRPLYVTGDYVAPARISFNMLSDAVLDKTDAQWKAQAEAKKNAQLAKLVAEGKQVPASAQNGIFKLSATPKTATADVSTGSKKGYNRRAYATVIMSDLMKLSDAGFVTEGKFDHWLLLFSVQLSHITTSAHELRKAIYEAAKIHGWELDRALAVMGTVISRAEAAFNGRKEEFNGKTKDPRYQYSRKRMVDLLGLNSKTILDLNLQALTTDDVRKERDRIRKAKYRKQAKAAQEQAEVVAERERKSRSILEMLSSGTSATLTAKLNNVSRQTVYNVINRNKALISHMDDTFDAVLDYGQDLPIAA